jgi:hypothetical protein
MILELTGHAARPQDIKQELHRRGKHCAVLWPTSLEIPTIAEGDVWFTLATEKKGESATVSEDPRPCSFSNGCDDQAGASGSRGLMVDGQVGRPCADENLLSLVDLNARAVGDHEVLATLDHLLVFENVLFRDSPGR